MKRLCPFCLSMVADVARCPVCHAVAYPLSRAPFAPPGCEDPVLLRQDASGAWLSARHEEKDVLVWAGFGLQDLNRPPSFALLPIETGKLPNDMDFCIWEMPAFTLAAHVRAGLKPGYLLWRELMNAGILPEGEWLPWEIVQKDGQWRVLWGRPASSFPPTGTLHAPERIAGAPTSAKTAVFTAAAWFLYIVSGQYPVGIPTPLSWKKTNLDEIDVLVFSALHADPSRRPDLPAFSNHLETAVMGKPVVRWLVDGVFWILGAVFLALWAIAMVWLASNIQLN